MDIDHYKKRMVFNIGLLMIGKNAISQGIEDTTRRKKLLQNMVTNHKWLDIGTGAGGILDELSSLASTVSAVEPQKTARNSLKKLGYDVYPSIESISMSHFPMFLNILPTRLKI